MYVARMLPRRLATLCNGELVVDAVGGGRAVKVSERLLTRFVSGGSWAAQINSAFAGSVAQCASSCALPLRRHPGAKLLVECLRRFTPRVAIMQTTEARHGSHHCA